MLELTDEVIAALRAIRAEAYRLEKGPGYAMVSVRSLAQKLGYDQLVDEILAACVAGSFSYCLDYTIPCGEHNTNPAPAVCIWGADQLRSRLDCVDYRVYSEHWVPGS